MKLRPFHVLFLGVLVAAVISGCSDDDDEESILDDLVSDITLSEEVIDVVESLGTVNIANKALTFNVGIGSGAFHDEGDPSDEFYTITDRGPNIACSETQEILEITNFCVNGGKVDEEGKIFPIPDFTPTIYKINIDTSGVLGTQVGYEVLETIKLRDWDDDPITGLTNPLRVMTTENSYDKNGNLLDFDPEGLDPEAIVRLSNGAFWIAEEYAPSLVHVAKNGRIMERIVPSGVESDLAAANYRVIGALPAILKRRQLNRGIESLAISPDEQFLYFMMQSPLANPDNETYKSSRNVRLFKLSLRDGDLDSVVGEYVYIIDEPETFTADNTTEQSDVKVSEMVALDLDKLVILERVSRHTKLYQVATLDNATNILGTGSDNEAAIPSLEQLASLASWGITTLDKKLVFDSRRDQSDLASKIEGMALLNNEYAVLINDNDFAVRGDKTYIRVTEIVEQLNQ